MTIRLRASSLSDFEGCQRRGGARFLLSSGLAREFGVTLNKTTQHIGAVVGTGAHAGAAVLMEEFANTGDQGGAPRLKRATDKARSEVDRLCAEPAITDVVTPTVRDAMDAASRITGRIHQDVIPPSKPGLIEKGYAATFKGFDGSEPFVVTGTIDLWLVHAALWDFKTGRNRPQPMAQQGSYSLILRSNGVDVRGAAIKFGKRPKKYTPSPKIETIPIDLPKAERHALSIARTAARGISDLIDSGNPDVLPANPACQLCSKKFCPAFNTDMCTVGHLNK